MDSVLANACPVQARSNAMGLNASNYSVVRCVSAPCGSGKTRAACHYIAARLADQPCLDSFLYVAPSKQLIGQIRVQLEALGVKMKVITSDSHPSEVVRAIVRHMLRFTQGGEVLLISHSAYTGLPYFPRHAGWQVIIDEVPQLDNYYTPSTPQELGPLVEHLEIEGFINAKAVRLRAKKQHAVKAFLDRAGDECPLVRKVLWDALSPNREILVDYQAWQRAVRAPYDAQEHCAPLISVLNDKPFENTVLMGAHVEYSLVGAMLQRNGARLREHAAITSLLRYRQYSPQLAARLSIHYVLDRPAWSKTCRDSAGASGRRIMEEMEDVIISELGGVRYLLAPNNDYHGRLAASPNCVRLPVMAHGLNDFAEHTNLVFLAALNRHPAQQALLQALGYSREIIRRSTAYEVLHQAVMRTNLRVPYSEARVKVIVPDRGAAEFLADLFKGAEVSKIGGLSYQRHAPLTPKERKQRYRLKKKLKAQHGQPRERNPIEHPMEKRSPPDAARPASEANGLMLTCCPDKYAKLSTQFFQVKFTPLELVKFFKEAAQTVIGAKEELVLMFTMTEFDPSIDPEGYRRQVNIKRIYGLVLDFDNGNLSPEEFERFFWLDAGRGNRFAFIICNSFSRRPEEPNRFRVIIPFRTPVSSLAEFQAIYDWFVDRLEEHGYPVSDAKLDPGCRSGNQPFYVPCTNRSYKEWAFCRAYGLTRTRDFNRHALDPTKYVVVPMETVTEPELMAERTAPPHDEASCWPDSVVTIQKKIREMSEGRHGPFFDMAVELRSRGYPLDQIEQILLETADNDPKMERKARDIMVSLRKYDGPDAAAA